MSKFKAEVRIKYQAKECTASNILEMLFLAAPQGSMIEIMARGPEADQVVGALADLVAAHFYEDDNGEDLQAKPGEPEPSSPSS